MIEERMGRRGGKKREGCFSGGEWLEEMGGERPGCRGDVNQVEYRQSLFVRGYGAAK